MPISTLLSVFFALIVLTILTVVVADSGLVPPGYDVQVAMAIATVKAVLVVLFFMHLIHDKGVNTIFFLFCLVFVSLFLGFALTDTAQYEHDIYNHQLEHPEAMPAQIK